MGLSSYPRKHSLQTNFRARVTIENYWGLKPFQAVKSFVGAVGQQTETLHRPQTGHWNHLPVRALRALTGLDELEQPHLQCLSTLSP